jgi:hypothetical protein
MSTAVMDIAPIIANPQTVINRSKASMVKSLIAQYHQLGVEETKIQESRKAVRELLVNMFEEGTEEMVIDGKSYATFTKETRTFLNTELIKTNFPEEKFPDFYQSSLVPTFRLTRLGRTLNQ